MRTDAIIKREGMQAIFEKLNMVEAERFITLLLSEPFDYTEWQRGLFGNMSVKELSSLAMGNRLRKKENI
jgi:hypothetical protein